MIERVRVAAAHSTIWRWLAPVREAFGVLAALVALLTRPAEAPAAADAAATALLAQSRTGLLLTTCIDRVEGAWQSSAVRQSAARALTSGKPSSGARVRAIGCATVSAAVVALVLREMGTRDAPLTWIVPVGAGIAGVLMMALAPAFAAALQHRKR